MELLIAVDEQDNALGTVEKMQAHRDGTLHRAFSVFLYDRGGNMLLQKRASGKYHSPGLWTNACCSHPRAGETLADAVQRRLREELGIGAAVEFRFRFHYRAELDNGLTEHELDHVYTGIFEGEVPFNPEEVSEIDFVPVAEIAARLRTSPEGFTAWFRLIFPQLHAI